MKFDILKIIDDQIAVLESNLKVDLGKFSDGFAEQLQISSWKNQIEELKQEKANYILFKETLENTDYLEYLDETLNENIPLKEVKEEEKTEYLF